MISSALVKSRSIQDKTTFKDVNPDHMELLLNFMYRGEISVAEIELMDLIDTAKGLTIHGLSEEDDIINKNPSIKIPQKKQLSKSIKRRKSPSKASPLGFSSAIHKFL